MGSCPPPPLLYLKAKNWEISFGPLGQKIQTKNSNQNWTGICAENGLRIGTWAKFGLRNGSHFPLFLQYPLKNPPLDTEVRQIFRTPPHPPTLPRLSRRRTAKKILFVSSKAVVFKCISLLTY